VLLAAEIDEVEQQLDLRSYNILGSVTSSQNTSTDGHFKFFVNFL
jgi:hypothetical protein